MMSICDGVLACLLSALQAVADPASHIHHPPHTPCVFESCFSTYVLLDCVSTWAPVSLTPLPPPLSFDPQHKRTASCGLLTARATRPYLCRAVWTAFLIQWSCLAGERQADYALIWHEAALYSSTFNTISPGSWCLWVTAVLHSDL